MDEIYEYNGKQYTLAQLQSKYGDKVQDAISKLGFKRVESAPKEETYTYKDKSFTRKDLEAKYGDKTDEAISKFGFESSLKKKEDFASTSPDPNLASETKKEDGFSDSTQKQYENKPILDEKGEQVYYTDKKTGELKPATQKVEKGYASQSEYDKAKKAETIQSVEKAKEEIGVFKDLTNRFKSGGLTALSGLAGLPNYINKLTESIFSDKETLDELNKLPENVREIVLAANNPQQMAMLTNSIEAQNFLTEKAEKLSEKTIKYEGNIVDDIGNGDFSKASYRVLQGSVESLPSMAMAIIPGGLVAIGAGTASQKQEEQDRTGKDLGLKTVANSFINGIAEGYFEKYTAGMLKPIKQMAFGNKEVAKEISKSLVKTIFKDIGIEGTSELLTSISQDLSDKLVAGEDISIPQIIKNAIDSGIIGGAMGGGTGSLAGIQSYVSTKTRSAETNKKLNDNAKISEELNKEIGNQPSKEVLDALKSKKDDIDNESSEIHKEEISKVEKLTNDEIKEVFEIDKEIKEASKTYKELDSQEMNPDIKNIIKKDIEEKTTKLEERKNEIVNPKDAKSETLTTETKEQAVEETAPKTKTFAEQLGETEDIGDIVQGATKTKVGDSDIVLKENGDTIKLESISTPTDKRGLGSAKKALNELTTLADAQGKTLELNVVPLDETTNPEKLVQLYESLGFTKEENFDIDGGKMTRIPNEKSQTENINVNADVQSNIEPSLQQGQEKGVNKSKEITDVLPKGGELKGITEVNVSDDGQELNYGTKTNKKSISVKGLSQQEIKDEIEFEKKILEKSKKDAENFNENEILNAVGLTSKEKQDAIKMHKQSLLNNEQTEKIVIPFYEKSLELLNQSEIKQPSNKETQQKQESETVVDNKPKLTESERKVRSHKNRIYKNPKDGYYYQVTGYNTGYFTLKDAETGKISKEKEVDFNDNFIDVTDKVEKENQGITSESSAYQNGSNFDITQFEDNVFEVKEGSNKNAPTYKVVVGTAFNLDDSTITKDGKPLRKNEQLPQGLLIAIQNHVEKFNPESKTREINRFLGREINKPIPVLDKDTKTKPISELNKNERKTQRNIVDDEKVQSRVGINDNKGKDNAVQPTVEPKASTGEVEVNKEIINLDNIADFITKTYIQDENNKQNPNKGTEKNSPNENIETPKRAEEKPKGVKLDEKGRIVVSKKGRKPLKLRAFKGDRKTASEIEPTDANTLALNYFVNGGKIASSYFKSEGELKARNNGLNGIANKKAKDIDAVVHDIWQSSANQNLKLSTSKIKNALEAVINENNTIQNVVESMLKNHGDKLEQSPQDIQDYHDAVYEVQEQEKATDEEMQEALGALDYLSDAEIIELAESQDKSYGDFIKDLDERRVSYTFGAFEETGTIQSDGSILSDNGDLLLAKQVSNVKQLFAEVKKESKPKQSDTPEIKEVNKQIEDANEKLRIAKDALDRKAKKLDKDLVNDAEDLFGERKTQNKNLLFDERVEQSARDKATEKERQAVIDATNEIKKLNTIKDKLEKGDIKSTKEIAFGKIDEAAQWLKDNLPSVKGDDNLHAQGITQDQLIDLIAKAVKQLVSTGIDVNDAIQQVVASIKEKFGVDIDPNDVKAKLEPTKPFKKKQGKKSLLNRLIEGDNPKVITETLETLGKEYDVRNQEEVDRFAQAFIDKVGIGEALSSARNKTIQNTDVRFIVYAEALERLKNEIDNANLEDRDALIEQFKELSNDFDSQARDAGQGIAILNYIYNKNQNLKYSLEKQIAEYKANDPNGEIPADILKKYKELDEKLKSLEKQTKEAEERAKKAEEALAIKNTKEDIERQKSTKAKQEKAYKILANKVRTAKIHKPGIFSSATPATLVWDGAIEIVAKSIEGGGAIADAVQKGLAYIKSTDWYKGLNKSEQSEAETTFKESIENTSKPEVVESADGSLKIQNSLLRYYVEQGYEDVNEIAELIQKDIEDIYPDVDIREIRDAITGYGKQVNPTRDDIQIKINKLREYGRLLSAYEDVVNGQLPLKSGLVRPKTEQKSRELRRDINRLAKELELQQIDPDVQWANAIDKIKSNLKNQIEDLDKQIANGEKRKIERTSVKLDAEAEALKNIRDEKRKFLDELVGKPELTEAQKVARAEALLEKSINKLTKEIEEGDIEVREKPDPKKSAKLDALRTEYKALKDIKTEMREQAGILEKQRLQTSKKRIQTQIDEYKRRLKEGDFSKRESKTVEADNELESLRAEREMVFEEYEKERHRQELLNRSTKQKWIDAIMEGFAIGRAIKASLDLGLIGIQLRHFTYREILNNPIGFTKKLSRMFGSIGSQTKTDKVRKQLLSHPLHSLANKLDIGLTNPDLRDEVREEASAGSLLSVAWNLPVMVAESIGAKNFTQEKRKSIGDTFIDGFKKKSNEVFGTNYKVDDKKKFSRSEQWRNLNLFKNVERGLSTYGNQMRFEEFLRGVERLNKEGKDPINHKEDFEALASYIRTFSGRAKPAGFQMNQKALNLFFFSFKNAASIFQQLNPVYYGYLQGKTSDNKNGNIRFKPTVANRMAMTSMLRTATANIATIAFIMAGYSAIKDEDDEEMTLETDPRSSDFGKLRVGSFRYDPWGGYVPLVTLYARLMTEEVKKQDGSIYVMGENYSGMKNRFDATGRFLFNKEAPITAMIHKYLTSTEDVDPITGETYRKTPYGGALVEDDAYRMTPIFMGSVQDAVKNDYDNVKWFLTAYSILGLGNTQDYGSPKDKKPKKEKTVDEKIDAKMKSLDKKMKELSEK